MIEVNVIPNGCICGWLAMGYDTGGYDGGADAPWRLVRPEPLCPQAMRHIRKPEVQLTLDELPEWEIGP